MLDKKLIEASLALTGKTMEDMNNEYMIDDFSIEKFFVYLLSKEFIDAYRKVYDDYDSIFHLPMIYTPKEWERATLWTACSVGGVIYEYGIGNEKPLIELLYKIGAK